MSRGHFAALLVALLAGACGSEGGGSGDGSGVAGAGAESGTGAVSGAGAVSGTGTGGSSGEGGTSEPYANVVAVSASGEPDAYSFAVTIESADIDCTRYADWWEVLDETGALLYRRILEHSHTDENGTTDPGAPGNTFTRSGGPIAIGADDVVIVRAHMSTGGYRGAVRRGSATSGFAEAPEIDSDFAPDVEDEPPLPSACQF